MFISEAADASFLPCLMAIDSLTLWCFGLLKEFPTLASLALPPDCLRSSLCPDYSASLSDLLVAGCPTFLFVAASCSLPGKLATEKGFMLCSSLFCCSICASLAFYFSSCSSLILPYRILYLSIMSPSDIFSLAFSAASCSYCSTATELSIWN